MQLSPKVRLPCRPQLELHHRHLCKKNDRVVRNKPSFYKTKTPARAIVDWSACYLLYVRFGL